MCICFRLFLYPLLLFLRENGIIHYIRSAMRQEISMGKKQIKKLFLFIVVILMAGCMISLWMSTNYLITREYAVDTGKSGGAFRAVVISDLHDHVFGEDNAELVSRIQQVKPDIIFMVGDMLNEDSPDPSVPVELIRQLTGIAPVYYALGNHEISYIQNGRSDLAEDIAGAGAVLLEKEYVDIEIKGIPVRLGGLYDYAFGLSDDNEAMDAPADVLQYLLDFEDTDRIKIMLSHRPDSFIFGDASEVWDIDLVVSGHLHGGQVVLPFLGGIYAGDQGWFPDYVHGLYQKGKLQLFITSGLGTNPKILPRFNNPPEIAVLTIK